MSFCIDLREGGGIKRDTERSRKAEIRQADFLTAGGANKTIL